MNTKKLDQVLVFYFMVSVFAFAQTDTGYMEGKAIIQVTTPFTSVDVVNNLVVTEQSWFNTLAATYEIYQLRQVFNSQQACFKSLTIQHFVTIPVEP